MKNYGKQNAKGQSFYTKRIARVTISEREKEFDEMNFLKDQFKELQEKLHDTAITQTAERAAMDNLPATENSQQIGQLSCHLSATNVELETEIKGKESSTTALDNQSNEGKILF